MRLERGQRLAGAGPRRVLEPRMAGGKCARRSLAVDVATAVLAAPLALHRVVADLADELTLGAEHTAECHAHLLGDDEAVDDRVVDPRRDSGEVLAAVRRVRGEPPDNDSIMP